MIDLNPGTQDQPTTLTYSGVEFWAKGQPDYVVEFVDAGGNPDVNFTTRTGGSQSTQTDPPGTASFFADLPGCAGARFCEVSVARSLFTGGSISGLSTSDDLGFYAFFFDTGTNYVYGGAPSGGDNPSGFANQLFRREIIFAHTDAGRSPGSYGNPTDMVPVVLSRLTID